MTETATIEIHDKHFVLVSYPSGRKVRYSYSPLVSEIKNEPDPVHADVQRNKGGENKWRLNRCYAQNSQKPTTTPG
jgi:hypothetical protein